MWLGDQADRTVIRVSMATNTVTAVIPLPGAATTGQPGQGHATGGPMVYAFGKLWTGTPAGVYDIDPSTTKATRLDVEIGNLWAGETSSSQPATATSDDRQRAEQSSDRARIVGTVQVNGEAPVEVDAIAETPEPDATKKSEK